MYYAHEIKALKRANRFRQRVIADDKLFDFSSNDYLGLSHKKELHIKTSNELLHYQNHSSKASMLVNGYHKIHQDFEKALCEANGFEDGIVLGSGFCANIALIESLVRKGDELFMDELYHASGVLASSINGIDVKFFKHNDMKELKSLLLSSKAKRKIVAVEGIYSMDGDLVDKEVFTICDGLDAILIVDEAHSSGVIGENLMGVFEHFDIEIKQNHIKMGTLGKAYGSFGAFILASKHIVEYLVNRAKPVIYATSLSLYDTLLAHNSLRYILENSVVLKKQIKKNQDIVYDELGIKIDGLIVPIVIDDNKKVLEISSELQQKGYLVGGIRQPTVAKAIIRLIARVGVDTKELQKVCKMVNMKQLN